jgi:hypothetical protein
MQHTDALTRLALDLSWSWNHSADEIWKKLDVTVGDLMFRRVGHARLRTPVASGTSVRVLLPPSYGPAEVASRGGDPVADQ